MREHGEGLHAGGQAVSPRARWLAFAALVLNSAVVLGALVLFLSNPLGLVLLIVAALLAVAGAWMVFSWRGARAVVGWIFLAAAAAMVAVEIVEAETRLGIRLALLVVLAAGAALTTLRLRLRYRPELAAAQAGVRPVPTHGPLAIAAPPRHPWLLVNNYSGGGRALKAGVADAARKMGVEVHELERRDDVVALARAAVAAGADALGSAGGDGSLGLVAGVAIEHGLPFVHVPAGTRCHFALDLGLDREDLLGALGAFREGVERRIDAGRLAGRTFLNNATFGLYGAMVAEPGYRDHKAATAHRVLSQLVAGERPLFSLRMTSPDGVGIDRAAMVLVGVNAYQTVELAELGRRMCLDCGVLQVNVLPSVDDKVLAGLVTRLSTEALLQWETDSVTIDSEDAMVLVGVDGEAESYASPVEVRLLPAALRIRIPPERAAVPASAARYVTPAGLWNIAAGRSAPRTGD